MNLRSMVWKELRERPWAMLTGMLTIFLAVTALVGTRHVSVFSAREIGRQLETLGANILILPNGATVQDYYSADLNGATLPEEQVSQIMLAGLTGIDKLSPRLCVKAEFQGQPLPLTGILPQSELQAQSAWQTVALFQDKSTTGCKKAGCGARSKSLPLEKLSSERAVDRLGPGEAIIGADVATRFRLGRGASINLLGERFAVLSVLAPTGTVDDGRIFVNLHALQELTRMGEVVSAIEVIGCCQDVAGQLVPQLRDKLPQSTVVTISQVVETQVGINQVTARSSMLMAAVLVVVGGASVASTISVDVRQRRREIGALVALGATPGFICRLFLVKAAWLGLAGGIAGSLIGTLLAVWLGPRWAGTGVSPLWGLAAVAAGAALAVSLLAAFWPARRASQLDPCTSFREE